VLHLKRFNHQGQFNTKINKHIEFSIDLTLDCSGEIPKQVEYRLVGVITHYGNSVHSGHYVAFVQVSYYFIPFHFINLHSYHLII
jgi:ubiquitin carboxyl-terminal hydrolase 36/42